MTGLIKTYLKNTTLVVPPQPAEAIDVVNPATGDRLGGIPDMGPQGVVAAALRSRKALPRWRALGAYKRGEILQRWADLIALNKADLANIITLEQGKPLRESRDEVDYALSFFRWYAEEGKRHYGEVIPAHKANARMITLRQPIGVTAAITPWNWPLAMITRKAGAALAAGCPMIVRAASETPFSAIALWRLAQEAGVPEGVFELVLGAPGPMAEAMMADRSIRAISFTGSTGVGKLLLRQGAETVKRMAMELGGHAPFIVCGDANLEAAVDGAMLMKFEAAGQSCTALNKGLVHADLYDAFCTRITERAAAVKVGDGMDESVDVGALTTSRAVLRCHEHVTDARAKGATLLTGGHPLDRPGNFYAPTVLKDVTPEMRIFSEETFGPILPVTRFTSTDEAIALANASDYGLAAYLYASDLTTIWKIMEALDFGMIGINAASMTGPPIPFGGVKESGLGREGSHQGLEDFTEIKYVCLGGIPDPVAVTAGETA